MKKAWLLHGDGGQGKRKEDNEKFYIRRILKLKHLCQL